jgi:hypothetical protein
MTELSLAMLPLFPLVYLYGHWRQAREEARAIEAARRRGDEIRRAYQSGFRIGLAEGEHLAAKRLTPERYTIGEWFFAMRDGRVAMRLK